MKCPYRNLSKESGCDLVNDPCGMSAAIAREFCDIWDCFDCPLFLGAMEEKLGADEEEPDEKVLEV